MDDFFEEFVRDVVKFRPEGEKGTGDKSIGEEYDSGGGSRKFVVVGRYNT